MFLRVGKNGSIKANTYKRTRKYIRQCCQDNSELADSSLVKQMGDPLFFDASEDQVVGAPTAEDYFTWPEKHAPVYEETDSPWNEEDDAVLETDFPWDED